MSNTFIGKFLSKDKFGNYNFMVKQGSKGYDDILLIHDKIFDGDYGYNPVTVKEEYKIVYIKLQNYGELESRSNYEVKFDIAINEAYSKKYK